VTKKKDDAPSADTNPEAEAEAGITGAALAEKAFDRSKHAEIEEAIKQLTPEEAAVFVKQIETSLKRKKLLLWGYLSVVLTLCIGTMWAFYMYGTREPGTFVGWVFLVPFGISGALFLLFGQLARRIE
jgi:hypothetical protein